MTSTTVIKRNKTTEPFNPEKISNAIVKAMESAGEKHINKELAEKLKNKVIRKLKTWGSEKPHVDQIHMLVEHSLMDAKLYEVARAYITYRDANKPDIFRERTAIRPYEYPQLIEYVDAVNHSYWLKDEFKSAIEADIQDFKVHLNEKEIAAATRAMLAIAQIESAVKKFWGRLGDRLPKPEVESVGATFADSEVRHERAYSELIEKLGLQKEFDTLTKIPCMENRIKYLKKATQNMRSAENRDFFETIILFSMFIENVSLFSQFLVLMSFNKHTTRLKGISNAIEATSKEENIHAMFGFDLVNIIREENPNWFDDDLIEYIKEIAYEAFEAEKGIVDWIYEKGDLEIIPKNVVIEYIKKRLNDSLKAIGVEPIFGVDEYLLKQVEWFEDEISVTKTNDFFHKRNTTYTKRNQSITEVDLF